MSTHSLEEPLVSIIIVNYNGIACTREAVLSILRFSRNSEVVVVDNCSADNSVDALRNEFPAIKVISLTENKGFGYGCNRGADAARGRYFFFLNNDTVLTQDTPSALSAYMDENTRVGGCGPKLLHADGTYQLSFGLDPSFRNEWTVRRWQQRSRNKDAALHASLEQQYGNNKVDWVTGAALMVRKDVFQRVGGFDESFFMYFEDADLCRRIRELGFDIMYLTGSTLIHLSGESAKKRKAIVDLEYRRSQVRYYRKHRSAISALLVWLYVQLRSVVH